MCLLLKVGDYLRIKQNNIALSQIAKKHILEYISKNKLKPDDTLPSEAELVKMLGVSRYTVREALALLEQEKIVYRIQGKGTFINRRPVHIESGLEKLESITEIIKNFGYKPGTKWLDIKEHKPTDDMVKKLGLKSDEKVITFKRIRIADDRFAACLFDTIPKKILKNQTPYKVYTESLFEYIEREYGINIEYAITEIIPTLPTKEMIKNLDIDEDYLFLLLHQIHYDKEGLPIIYSLDYFDPSIFKFKINRRR